MNRQLNRLALVAIVLLAVLVVATTYWQTWAVAGLQDRQDNAIQRVVQFTVARGLIEGADGKTVFAKNRKVRRSGESLFFRTYPQHKLAAQTVGYSTASRAQSGLERSMNDYLTGANTNLSNAFRTILDRLGPATVHGSSLVLTIRPKVQALAERLLGTRCGSVVAMNPHTGAVYVMASSPTYDLNQIEQTNGYAHVLKIRGECRGASALYNRATQGLYTPGSTFKVVTAAAALDTGAFNANSSFYDPGYCEEYGKQVSNAGNPDQGGRETFGRLNFTTALQHSVNSVFCNIGKQLGAGTVLAYAKKFGFYKTPPLETPGDERFPSGLYKGSKLYDPKDPATQVDPGRLAFGQERMLATPLQMAMVAATIGNGGVVPQPYVVQKIVAPDGSTVRNTKPANLGRAIKPETAATLTQMMVTVTEGGTGNAAAIPGIHVAGKTGTAETNTPHVYTAWFISFAPAENPQVAVAVVLEEQANGFGGAVSAPIAKQVMEALLAR
ncbi:MAG TPA: penicillin-binding protein 2 [Gaiellaceae bacterium]|nr:penicillin-binding protein 2 [Gaiellaceae bacterium]